VKNSRLISAGLLSAVIGTLAAAGCASQPREPAALRAQARITKEQAEQAALAKVPGGTIKQSELNRENGDLIWYFDLTTRGSAAITEVAVDALTGYVISVATETPE
jgi:uncharacterized membrane protein YkoI